MVDTVLTLCKASVKEFVEFVLKFCPTDTEIVTTNKVVNTFDKVLLGPDDSDYEEAPYQDVPEGERDELQTSLVWLHGLFDKNKDPEPLFVLDLILKQNQLIPTYSTPPDDIVARIMGVFDEGINVMTTIP